MPYSHGGLGGSLEGLATDAAHDRLRGLLLAGEVRGEAATHGVRLKLRGRALVGLRGVAGTRLGRLSSLIVSFGRTIREALQETELRCRHVRYHHPLLLVVWFEEKLREKGGVGWTGGVNPPAARRGWREPDTEADGLARWRWLACKRASVAAWLDGPAGRPGREVEVGFGGGPQSASVVSVIMPRVVPSLDGG